MYGPSLIQGKKIYVVEQHHHSLIPWADLRQKLDSAFALLSFDCHTDTHPAFVRYAYESLRPHAVFPDDKEVNRIIRDRVARTNYADRLSLQSAIADLHNDEHIKLAIWKNIINCALISCWTDSGDYCDPDDPDDEIYVCSRVETGYDNENYGRNFDPAIESDFLTDRLRKFSQLAPEIMSGCEIRRCYVLDIDLDYFRTTCSLSPKDPCAFYKLIRAAELITIATEPKFVAYNAIPKNSLDPETMLQQLKEHIRKAMSE